MTRDEVLLAPYFNANDDEEDIEARLARAKYLLWLAETPATDPWADLSEAARFITAAGFFNYIRAFSLWMGEEAPPEPEILQVGSDSNIWSYLGGEGSLACKPQGASEIPEYPADGSMLGSPTNVYSHTLIRVLGKKHQDTKRFLRDLHNTFKSTGLPGKLEDYTETSLIRAVMGWQQVFYKKPTTPEETGCGGRVVLADGTPPMISEWTPPAGCSMGEDWFPYFFNMLREVGAPSQYHQCYLSHSANPRKQIGPGNAKWKWSRRNSMADMPEYIRAQKVLYGIELAPSDSSLSELKGIWHSVEEFVKDMGGYPEARQVIAAKDPTRPLAKDNVRWGTRKAKPWGDHGYIRAKRAFDAIESGELGDALKGVWEDVEDLIDDAGGYPGVRQSLTVRDAWKPIGRGNVEWTQLRKVVTPGTTEHELLRREHEALRNGLGIDALNTEDIGPTSWADFRQFAQDVGLRPGRQRPGRVPGGKGGKNLERARLGKFNKALPYDPENCTWVYPSDRKGSTPAHSSPPEEDTAEALLKSLKDSGIDMSKLLKEFMAAVDKKA